MTRRLSRPRPALPILLIPCALLAACAPHKPIPVANLAPASSPLHAADVFPNHPQSKHYAAVEPGAPFILRTLTPTPDGGLDVHSRIFTAGSDPTRDTPIEDRILRLSRAPDGAILLISSAEADRTTLFEPPLIYMPTLLAPGQTFESATDARVVNAAGRQQSSGRATRRLTYAGDQATPDAPRILQGQLELALFPARVLTNTTFWVTPEGIIREAQRTDIRIFGLPAESRRHDVLLRAPSEPAP